LDDLKESPGSSYGDLGKHGLSGAPGNSDEPKWVRVGRAQPQHALALHVDGGNFVEIIYTLDGKYRKFSAIVAIPDYAQNTPPMAFRILGDGRYLWNSPSLRKPGETANLVLSVQGIKELRIEVHNQGGIIGTGVYLNPLLSVK
jgi:hypothetical protein